MNKIKNILKSKTFKTVIITFGVLAIVSFIFQAGQMVGFRKASFGRDWGNNYAMNFGSPNIGPKMMGDRLGDLGSLPNAGGAIGKIIKIELPTIVVLDEKDKTEKVVLIDDKTQIRMVRENITKDNLKIDEYVVIMGIPNSSGQIEARLIRILPAPLSLPINN
jgi:hypothetical protein